MARSRVTATGGFVTGIAEVDKRLRELPLSLQKKGARKATRRVAKAVQEEALRLVPVKSGALKKSLIVRAAKRSRKKENMHDVAAMVITRDGMFKGNQYYAGFLEYGTKKRWSVRQTKRSDGPVGQFRGAIPAEKFWFLRPALYRNQNAKYRMFVDELGTWLRSV